jgi:hypothetical protein
MAFNQALLIPFKAFNLEFGQPFMEFIQVIMEFMLQVPFILMDT